MESNQCHAARTERKKHFPCRNVASNVKLTELNVSSSVKKNK